MRDGTFSLISWSRIRAGDLLKVKRNEQIPADAVFLSSSSTDADTPDSCYVQTAQLDGETNLKLRVAVPSSVAYFTSDKACADFRGSIVCEAPNAAFDKFVGLLRVPPAVSNGRSINIDDGSISARSSPLEAEQLLLRGVYVRNVDTVYAMVVYTGRETKVRVRQTSRTSKRASMEQDLNKLIIFLVTFLLAVCLLGTIGHVIWTDSTYQNHWYFGPQAGRITVLVGVHQFFTFFLLNAAFIPVSLYVSVRLARSLQLIFMEADMQMLHVDPELVKSSHGEEGSFPFKVRSVDLNDELGQVTHIFSDKTGTLTLNYMEWRKLLVNGVSHGLGTTQIGIDRLRREGKDVSHLIDSLAAEKLLGSERGAQLPHVNFEDGSESNPGRTLGSDSRNPSDGAQGQAIHDILLNLALNHTVLPEIVRDSREIITGTRLSASSPDEEAFCYAAETLGYKFVSRTHEGIVLKIRHAANLLPLRHATVPVSLESKAASANLFGGVRSSGTEGFPGTEYPFRILHVLAYSQARKRMSIIVEHPIVDTDGSVHVTGAARNNAQEGGDIYLYCKGADSIIIPNCNEPRTPAEADVRSRTVETLANWGGDGLRTLVFAQRKISREEYVVWARQYETACVDIEELRKKKDKRPNAIEELQTAIETGLTLQGAVANEDKLQPEVPETIALFAKAGIKLWMVTGDKQETAVNIGFATKLLTESQRHIVATMESAGGINAAMRRLRIAAKRMHAEKAVLESARLISTSGSASSWALTQISLIERSLGIRTPLRNASQVFIISPGSDAFVENPVTPYGTPRVTVQEGGSSPFPNVPTKAISFDHRDGFESDAEEEAIAKGEAERAELAIGHVSSPAPQKSFGTPLGTSLKEPSTPCVTSLDNPMNHSVVVVDAMGEGGGAAVSPSVVGNPAHPMNMMKAASTHVVNNIAHLTSTSANRPFALIIDEHCLDAALQNPRAKAYLLYIAINCDAVIACRARPDQKAQVVRLIREGVRSSVTMAVGDGANDVDMIGAAHVGIGIAGAEGIQAANASDYSIGRFRFLQRLLLVHGRWNYSRMTRLVLYMFWKNVMFVVCQFFYQTINGWSGQKWYVELAAQIFNIVFTGLPPLILAVTDRDMNAEWVLRFPKLYDHGRLARGLSTSTFIMWMLDAVALAALFFVLSVYGYSAPDGLKYPAGGVSYIFQLGTVAFSMVIVAASVRIGVESFQHTWFVQAAIAASAIAWIPLCFIFDAMKQDGMLGGNRYIFTSVNFWLVVLLGGSIMSVRLLAWKAWKRLYMPELRHIVAEVAAASGDARSIEQYADAADLARRTGKPLHEIITADRIASAAAEVLAPIAAFTGKQNPANSFLANSPVRSGDTFRSDYVTLSGGDTPEDMSRQLLMMKPSAYVTTGAMLQLQSPEATLRERNDLLNVTRRAILEGSLLPSNYSPEFGASEFDAERTSDAPITPIASPPVIISQRMPLGSLSEMGEKVAIEDMKARLAASVTIVSARAAGGKVGAISRTWPPGTKSEEP